MGSRSHPKGVSYAEFERLTAANPASRAQWQRMIRNPIVHARGEVRHRDHKTIQMDVSWHPKRSRSTPETNYLSSIHFGIVANKARCGDD
jgi:hypothetical protein